MTHTRFDLIIVGAGLSGLMAATTLADSNRRIMMLDKGRSVGGRLATRRIGSGRADHGAQFFTVRDERFRAYVDSWLTDGLVYAWSTGWSSGSVDDAPPDGHPRYAVHGGMNALAKRLARELTNRDHIEVQTSTTVTKIGVDGDGWCVTNSDQIEYHTNRLLLTAPVPQSLALLDAGDVPLSEFDREALARIEYAPCLCGLALIDGAIALPSPGALQRIDAPISWIADNQAKGISPDAAIVTVHAGPALSRTHYEAEDAVVEPILIEALTPHLLDGTTIEQFEVKRWRYALPTVFHADRYLEASGLPPLFFAGDAFGGPRIEGAALSGIRVGEAIRNR